MKCKDPLDKQRIRDEYRQTQFLFDKFLRFYKRKFWKGQSLRFDYLQINNPQQFWKEINKLGPKRVQIIPTEVIINDDLVETRKEFVLKKWEQDFADLFSGNQISSNFDDDFLREACVLKNEMERNMVQDEFNIILNSDISLEEVRAVIHKSKVKKAVGVEEIPNEVLKSLSLLNVLLSVPILL